MFKTLSVTVLALVISVFAINKHAFSQEGSTNEHNVVLYPGTPSDPFITITVPGYGQDKNQGSTNENEGSTKGNEGNTYKNEDNPYTINYEVFDKTGNTNEEKFEKDGDTNGGTKYNNEQTKYKQDRGLHKGWYKKGKHKGRQ